MTTYPEKQNKEERERKKERERKGGKRCGYSRENQCITIVVIELLLVYKYTDLCRYN